MGWVPKKEQPNLQYTMYYAQSSELAKARWRQHEWAMNPRWFESQYMM